MTHWLGRTTEAPDTFISSPSSNTFEQKNISDFRLTYVYQRLESMTEFLRDLITTRFKDRIPSKGPTIIQYKYRHHPLCFSDRFEPSMAKKQIKTVSKTSDFRSEINRANQIKITNRLDRTTEASGTFISSPSSTTFEQKIFPIFVSIFCTKDLNQWLNFYVTW